jgi:hypothetical protein
LLLFQQYRSDKINGTPDIKMYNWLLNSLYVSVPRQENEWKIINNPSSLSSFILREMSRDGFKATSVTMALLLKLFAKKIQIVRYDSNKKNSTINSNNDDNSNSNNVNDNSSNNSNSSNSINDSNSNNSNINNSNSINDSNSNNNKNSKNDNSNNNNNNNNEEEVKKVIEEMKIFIQKCCFENGFKGFFVLCFFFLFFLNLFIFLFVFYFLFLLLLFF